MPRRAPKPPYAVRWCSRADAEHRASDRQYAHTYHVPGAICVAHAFGALPPRVALAILLHECGHLLAGPKGGEVAADRAAHTASGMTIHYRDSAHGPRLETIGARDVPRARRWLTTMLRNPEA